MYISFLVRGNIVRYRNICNLFTHKITYIDISVKQYNFGLCEIWKAQQHSRDTINLQYTLVGLMWNVEAWVLITYKTHTHTPINMSTNPIFTHTRTRFDILSEGYCYSFPRYATASSNSHIYFMGSTHVDAVYYMHKYIYIYVRYPWICVSFVAQQRTRRRMRVDWRPCSGWSHRVRGMGKAL